MQARKLKQSNYYNYGNNSIDHEYEIGIHYDVQLLAQRSRAPTVVYTKKTTVCSLLHCGHWYIMAVIL